MRSVVGASVHDVRVPVIRRHGSRGSRLIASAAVVASLAAVLTANALAAPAQRPAAAAAAAAPIAQDWPTYLHDAGRSSASADAILNTGNVGGLVKKWSRTTGGIVAASPAVVNGIVYVGSWDGNEYALNGTSGAVIWQRSLGTTFDPPCVPPHLGITSSATVVNGVVYVGGGDSFWYALSATDGTVLWKIFTGDNSQGGAHYNWSSPLIVGNFGYIGIASNCDAPLVQGEVLKVDLTTHQVVGTAKMVPDGQVGGGVWTSPAYDPATNTIFVSTGTLNLYSQTMSQAIVSIDAGTMAIKDHWQLPFEEAVSDSDWGTTPTLTVDAQGRALLSVTNKNGVVYTLARNNLGAGPVWQRTIAIGGDCPPCGDGSIASAAFAGAVLYQAGGSNVVNGEGHGGSVSALNPGTGAVLWYHPTNEPVIGSIVYSNGLIVVPQGQVIEVLDSATGHSLWTYKMKGSTYAAPAVSRGIVYIGGLDNQVHAFGLPAIAPVIPPPDANCPAGFTCQDIGHTAIAGSEKTNPDGTITATVSGHGDRNALDQTRLITEPVSGDVQISTEVLSNTGGAYVGGDAPQTGIMLRQTNDPGAPYYAALLDPTYPNEHETLPNVIVFYRDQFSTQVVELTQAYPQTFPRWIMVQRHDDTFQTLTSGDGTNWTLIGGTIHRVVMPATLLGGVAVSSGSPTVPAVATFTKPVASAPTQTFARQASAHACPATWSCEDVAAGSPIGDQTLVNGAWTVYGDASGITGSTDQFHYVFRTLPGDGTVVARLTSIGSSSAAAQAAVLMRADDTEGSPYYGIVARGDGSAKVQWRANSNLTTRPTVVIPSTALPRWYQIQRYTDTVHTPVLTYYTALTSTDGAQWTQVPGSTVALNLGPSPLAGIGGSSFDGSGRTLNPSKWDNVSTSNVRVPAPGICPSGFTCQDVGVGYAPGTQTLSNTTWNFQAGGSDIWDVYDQFHFVSQPMTADGTVSARVVAVGPNPQGFQKSGVMVRTSSDPQAPYYGVFQSPAHGVLVQWRPTQAAPTSQIAIPGPAPAYPVYVMIGRWTDPKIGGTYYTAYTSTDNRTFTAVPGSTMALNMPGTLLAGLAADSYDEKTSFPVTFDSLALLDKTEPVPPGACPYDSFAGCADVGGATPAGSQTFTGGTLTASVGGGDIWATADQFHLVWQTLAADGSVSARVASQQNTGPWAKAGVMLRATTDAGSPYYGIFVTPSKGIAVQYRSTQGAATNGIFVAGAAPVYLRVNRFTDGGGTVFYTAYTSPDGTTWTAVPGSTVSLAMPGTLLAGYAANSYSQANSSTVVFDTLSVGAAVTPPAGACVAPWQCVDVGGATPAGGQSITGSNLTVQGGGGDIWDVSDQFRLLSQPLAGDGTITAGVSSQQATNAWAKAGLMMRATTAAGSPYYSVLVTPANGLLVQWRTTPGATTSQLAVAGAVPVHLQLSRWTDTTTGITYYSAYRSPDGVTWTLVPGSTVALSMPGSLLAGVAVTSHNTSSLGQVAYAGVGLGTTSSKPPGLAP